MNVVWQVTWNAHLDRYNGVKELLNETFKDDMICLSILFTTREKAEEYVEKVSKKIASAVLVDLINFSEDESEKSEWKSRSYEKVRWDEASEEKLDQHERHKTTSTTYWIEPEHCFDDYGVYIAGIGKREVR